MTLVCLDVLSLGMMYTGVEVAQRESLVIIVRCPARLLAQYSQRETGQGQNEEVLYKCCSYIRKLIHWPRILAVEFRLSGYVDTHVS